MGPFAALPEPDETLDLWPGGTPGMRDDPPVETHLFAEGGHGFGLRNAAGEPAAVWPELFHAWSRSIGLVHT